MASHSAGRQEVAVQTYMDRPLEEYAAELVGSNGDVAALLNLRNAELLYLLLARGLLHVDRGHVMRLCDKMADDKMRRASMMSAVCCNGLGPWEEGLAVCMWFNGNRASRSPSRLNSPWEYVERYLQHWGRDPDKGMGNVFDGVMQLQRLFYCFILLRDTGDTKLSREVAYSPHVFPSRIEDNEHLRAVKEAPQCVREYAKYMASVESGFTPLMCAARHGCEYGVRLLIDKYGVDPDARDRDGRTAAEQFGASDRILDYIKAAQAERRQWLLAIGMAGSRKLAKNKTKHYGSSALPTDVWDKIIRMAAKEQPGAPRVFV